MYYLSDQVNTANFRFGRNKKSNLESNQQLIGRSASQGINDAGKAFVGLAVTAKATPQALMRYQLRGYAIDPKKRKGLSKVVDPILRRVVGDESIFGDIRQQSIDDLKRVGINTKQISQAQSGKRLKATVRSMYRQMKKKGAT